MLRNWWKKMMDRWKYDKIADTVYFMLKELNEKEIQRVLVCVSTKDLYVALKLKRMMLLKGIDTDDYMEHAEVDFLDSKDFV